MLLTSESIRTLVRGFHAAGAFLLLLWLAGCVHTVEGETMPEAQSKEDRAKASVELGLAHLRNGDRQSAKRPLLHALDVDPRSPDVHHALAIMYAGDLEHGLAYEHYTRALQLKPDYTQARNNFGAYLHSRGRYVEAIEQMQLAAADTLYPRRFVVFENLGLAYLETGRVREAEEAFRRALNLNPNQSRSHLELAELYFNTGKIEPSYNHFQRFQALNDGADARALWLGIRLQRKLENRDAVASYALQLRNLFPASEEYRLYRETVE